MSVAVAVPGLTFAEQVPGSVLAVILAGHVIVGFSLSTTITSRLQVELLPALSVAVQVMVVVPTGNGSVNDRLGVATTVPSQLSVAVATPGDTLAAQVPGATLTVMFVGQVIVGP